MRARIVLLPGDGDSPERIDIAARTLSAAAAAFGHTLSMTRDKVGGASIDQYGSPLTEETLRLCREADAVLLGQVGGDKWSSLQGDARPEAGVEILEDELNLCAEVCPVRVYRPLSGRSPLKAQCAALLDCALVRALTLDPSVVEGAACVAFLMTVRQRRQLFTAPPPGRREGAWKSTVRIASAGYPAISPVFISTGEAVERLLTDAARVGVLFLPPASGELILGMAAAMTGTPAALCRMRLDRRGHGLFSPAPVAGADAPYAAVSAVNTAAMLLRHALSLENEAALVETALDNALANHADSGSLAARVIEQISLAAAVRGTR